MSYTEVRGPRDPLGAPADNKGYVNSLRLLLTGHTECNIITTVICVSHLQHLLHYNITLYPTVLLGHSLYSLPFHYTIYLTH